MFQHKYLIFNKECTLLTYAVQTKIKIDDLASFKDVKSCHCGSQATKYCENDSAYFCEECDILIHESHQKDHLSKIMTSHKRVNVDARIRDFENCSEHPTRKNEFYCYCC